MKPLSFYIILLFFLMGNALWAQPKEMDYHEVLNVGEVFVAPDGTIWNMPYYPKESPFQRLTMDDTLWRNYSPKYHSDTGMVDIQSSGGAQHFNIVFPNDSTILMVDPYLSRDSTVTYYQSKDNGKNWCKFRLTLVRDRDPKSVITRNGKIWMFLVQGYLYSSEDGGTTFHNVPSSIVKPKCSYDASHVYMEDDGRNGVLCGYHGNIFATGDNWATSEKLEDPFDQGLLPGIDWTMFRISRLQSWNNFLFLEANEKVFFAERESHLSWKTFPAQSFIVDTTSAELLLVAENGYLLRTADLQRYDTIAHLPEGSWYKIISCVDGRVYCQGKSSIYVVSDTGTREFGLYTENPIKISKYDRVKVAGRLYSSDRNILYCFDKTRKQWYRVYTPFKEITDISAYGTETDTILLSDGHHSYLFSIHDPALSLYRMEHPLADFLQYPIESVKITAKRSGCFGSRAYTIEYCRHEDEFVKEKADKQEIGLYDEDDSLGQWASDFDKSFSASELQALLRDLDEHYDQNISWQQFDITGADVDSMCVTLGGNEFNSYYFRRDSVALQWIHDTILKIDDDRLTDILMSPPRGYCTTTSKLVVRLTNSKGVVQILECDDEQCSTGTTPYMLPLKIQHEGQVVYSSHIPFMQFVSSLMPDGMVTKEKFTIHELFCKVGRVLLEEM